LPEFDPDDFCQEGDFAMEWMFMPLKRYADFSGRSRRMEFWMWQLFQLIVYIVVVVLAMMLGGGAMMMMGSGNDPSTMLAAGGAMMIVLLLYGVYCLAVLIPSIAVAVRRLHDTNRTGWWVLAPLAPYLVMIVLGMMAMGSPENAGVIGIVVLLCMLAVLALALMLLIFYVLEGTKGPNQYGPDPKGGDAGQVFS
jgi:uncharacterized membrane protein YhaH (DUF805 family)